MSLITSPWINLISKDPNSVTAIDPVILPPSSTAVAGFPLNMTVGGTLVVETNNYPGNQTITFDVDMDFADKTAATLNELIAAINAHPLNDLIASNDGGTLLLSAVSNELTNTLEIIGGTANVALAFPVATTSRVADVAFIVPGGVKDEWGKVVFGIAETTNYVTAVTATIDVYGWVPNQSIWHKIQTVIISEAGVCDFIFVAPIEYSWIYLSHSAGGGSYKACMLVSS